MEYIRITKENIDKEHICCAMSGKQSLAKKEWLKQRFEEGLVFYRSAERGKCFIEYIPAENAWVPIDADGYLYINCLWVSGSLKGHGYSSELLEECLRDAKAQGKNGVCILCAEGRKREFLADPKFLTHKGFPVPHQSDFHRDNSADNRFLRVSNQSFQAQRFHRMPHRFGCGLPVLLE